MQQVTLPLVFLAALEFALLLLALRLQPATRPNAPATTLPLPAWDLPMRMVVATVFVFALTTAAPALGPHLAGLLAPFPLYGATLAGFAHQRQGADAAVRVLRGLLYGLFGFAGFFLVLAALLEPAGIAVAFIAATLVALACQMATLRVLRAPA